MPREWKIEHVGGAPMENLIFFIEDNIGVYKCALFKIDGADLDGSNERYRQWAIGVVECCLVPTLAAVPTSFSAYFLMCATRGHRVNLLPRPFPATLLPTSLFFFLSRAVV